jgi:hypothetical protein
MVLYALHSDSDLDAEKIYHSLSSNPELERNTMSVAEKLIAQGRVEGRVEGLWILNSNPRGVPRFTGEC